MTGSVLLLISVINSSSIKNIRSIHTNNLQEDKYYRFDFKVAKDGVYKIAVDIEGTLKGDITVYQIRTMYSYYFDDYVEAPSQVARYSDACSCDSPIVLGTFIFRKNTRIFITFERTSGNGTVTPSVELVFSLDNVKELSIGTNIVTLNKSQTIALFSISSQFIDAYRFSISEVSFRGLSKKDIVKSFMIRFIEISGVSESNPLEVYFIDYAGSAHSVRNITTSYLSSGYESYLYINIPVDYLDFEHSGDSTNKIEFRNKGNGEIFIRCEIILIYKNGQWRYISYFYGNVQARNSAFVEFSLYNEFVNINLRVTIYTSNFGILSVNSYYLGAYVRELLHDYIFMPTQSYIVPLAKGKYYLQISLDYPINEKIYLKVNFNQINYLLLTPSTTNETLTFDKYNTIRLIALENFQQERTYTIKFDLEEGSDLSISARVIGVGGLDINDLGVLVKSHSGQKVKTKLRKLCILPTTYLDSKDYAETYWILFEKEVSDNTGYLEDTLTYGNFFESPTVFILLESQGVNDQDNAKLSISVTDEGTIQDLPDTYSGDITIDKENDGFKIFRTSLSSISNYLFSVTPKGYAVPSLRVYLFPTKLYNLIPTTQLIMIPFSWQLLSNSTTFKLISPPVDENIYVVLFPRMSSIKISLVISKANPVELSIETEKQFTIGGIQDLFKYGVLRFSTTYGNTYKITIKSDQTLYLLFSDENGRWPFMGIPNNLPNHIVYSLESFGIYFVHNTIHTYTFISKINGLAYLKVYQLDRIATNVTVFIQELSTGSVSSIQYGITTILSVVAGIGLGLILEATIRKRGGKSTS